MIAMLLVWCPLLTGYEPELVCDNLCKMAPRPPLSVVQVYGKRVSSKGHEFELLSVCTLYTCGLVVGRSQVRESVRYITHNSYAISVVLTFNKELTSILLSSLQFKLSLWWQLYIALCWVHCNYEVTLTAILSESVVKALYLLNFIADKIVMWSLLQTARDEWQ